MAKFAPLLVATEESKVRCFEEGLRPRVKKQAIIPFELTLYSVVVSKELFVERKQLMAQEVAKAQYGNNRGGGSTAKGWKNKRHNQKKKHDQGNN